MAVPVATLNTQNHDLRGFNQCGSGLPWLQSHFASRTGGDNRCDLLTADGDLHFGHEAADSDGVDAPDELIAPADATDDLMPLLFGSASRAKEQAIDFRLWDAMMPPGSLNAFDLLLIDPLFDCGEADAELQSRFSQLQQWTFVV